MDTGLLIIPFVVMLAPVLIAVIALRYRRAQTEARYRTLLQLADKGVALPHELLAEPSMANVERRRRTRGTRHTTHHKNYRTLARYCTPSNRPAICMQKSAG